MRSTSIFVASERQPARGIVLLAGDDPTHHIRTLARRTGIRLALSTEPGIAATGVLTGTGDGALLATLGIALIHADPALRAWLGARAGAGIRHVGAERTLRALGLAPAVPHDVFADTLEATWGVHVLGAATTAHTGAGVRVAILDSGIDGTHPDFADRELVAASFVGAAATLDRCGHGTHCAGVAAGAVTSGRHGRYGIAADATLCIGRVLDDLGGGSDATVLAALDWAVRQRCAVVSLSVGTPADDGQRPSPFMEHAAARALAAGTLVLAAAGNTSERPAMVSALAHPANCPSILSVGALTTRRELAAFSAGGRGLHGGEADCVAPGIGVAATWAGPSRYRRHTGTSTATAYAAGIAALWAEAYPDARGPGLRKLLLASAKPLGTGVRDGGAGLIQAPQ